MRMNNKFKHLCEPIIVGGFNLKNRIVLAPAHVNLNTHDGGISPEFIDYLEARAKGGTAMIIMGVGLVKTKGRAGAIDTRMDHDRYIPGLYKLNERIHYHNCVTCAQLFHAGRYAKEDPISASNVGGYDLAKNYFTPRAMSIKEIEDMVESFANAALRAKKANFNMVEIHGATGYLVLQFYSQRTNKRKDKYGGTLENRLRFPLEIVSKIKEQCGNDFPVGFKMIGDERLPDGFTLNEAKVFAKKLEETGVAYISVAAGTYETRYEGEGSWSIRSPAAPSVPIAAAIKETVKVPVISNGQINDPVMMEQILREGKADLIGLARPLFSDPDFANKVIRGEPQEIRMCTHCCQCFWNLIRGWPVRCFQNPEMGRERDYKISMKPLKSKKVLVIGGGPGGLEAARVAALRGHNVALWEKENELGGQLLLASKLPGKEVFYKYNIQWLAHQCEKAKVDIHLNRTATFETVREFTPEVVIMATGASLRPLDIPGEKGKNVLSFKDIITGDANLKGAKVVIIGGGLIGTEIAELLAIKGNTVVLLEMLSSVAMNMDPFNRAYLLNNTKELDITIMTDTTANKIKESMVLCTDRKKKRMAIEYDHVVIAAGTTSNNGMVHKIETLTRECYQIGDCVRPRTAKDAIHEGSYFAREI
jgi:2,4-dienoyl-CoA reductase-like NADH-dependent reductase (Old Yellow Enzyme family)/thioredoxin reductase